VSDAEGMKAAPNRLVCGGRAVMVAPVRRFQMIAGVQLIAAKRMIPKSENRFSEQIMRKPKKPIHAR